MLFDTVFFAVVFYKVFSKAYYILFSLSQRRYFYQAYIESIIQVLPETSLFNQSFQGNIIGAYHSNIDCLLLRSAHSVI